MTGDDGEAADRLRRALGRADALASATSDLLAGLPVDDARGRERAAYLAEMCAEECEEAVGAAGEVIAALEGTAPGGRGTAERT